MKSIVKCSVLLISIFSLLGCSQGQNSSNTNTSASDTSENISSTSSKTGTFSYDLPEKEKGLTLEAFENELNKLNPKDARKVRYHYHSEEKLIALILTFESSVAHQRLIIKNCSKVTLVQLPLKAGLLIMLKKEGS